MSTLKTDDHTSVNAELRPRIQGTQARGAQGDRPYAFTTKILLPGSSNNRPVSRDCVLKPARDHIGGIVCRMSQTK